jgi:hypothetical protein
LKCGPLDGTLGLLKPYEEKGYHVYWDNYYDRCPTNKNTRVSGTIHLNHCLPKNSVDSRKLKVSWAAQYSV